MRSLRDMIVILLGLLSHQALATTAWQDAAVQVLPNSAMQKQIDSVTTEIFQNSKSKFLCRVFNNPENAVHSLGVSAEAAEKIFRQCRRDNRQSSSKIMAKKYYISFVQQSKLDSWTDYGNRTFIFADSSLNREKLKSIIAHEMSIAADAKTNMLYTTYLLYRSSGVTENSNGGAVLSLGNLSEQEKALQYAFNSSTWKPISTTFATLRAFKFEEMLRNNDQINLTSHSTCVANFRNLFKTIQRLPEIPSSEGVDNIAELMASMTSESMAPKSKEQRELLINFLMSPNLQLLDHQGQKLSFCQFMSTPLLTGKSLFNFFGSGPRPRLTGGSGGQGQSSQEFSTIDKQRLKDSLQKGNTLEQKSFLKDDFQKALDEITPQRLQGKEFEIFKLEENEASEK